MSTCWHIVQYLYVAYTSSNASSPKYTASGSCGFVSDSFGANTQLLRPYARHSLGTYNLIRGVARY